MALEHRPSVIITDANMPEMDGFALCRLLRQQETTKDIPIIMISGRAVSETNVVAGLEGGADDYVLKPVSLPVLLARIKAILRRKDPVHDKTLQAQGIALDPGRRTVEVDGKQINLTRKEFDLLTILMAADGKVVSPQTLLADVWGYDLALYNNPHTVEVHFSSLRKKLGPGAADRLVRLSGVGFKFEK